MNGLPCFSDAELFRQRRTIIMTNHQQIHITPLIGGTVGIRTKDDHTLRLKLLNQHAQIRQKTVCDVVDGMARIADHAAARAAFGFVATSAIGLLSIFTRLLYILRFCSCLH